MAKKEKVDITYNQSKINVHGQTFTLILDASLTNLMGIYSSGSGSSFAQLILKEEPPKSEVLPVKIEEKKETKASSALPVKNIVAEIPNKVKLGDTKMPIVEIEEVVEDEPVDEPMEDKSRSGKRNNKEQINDTPYIQDKP